MIAKRQKVQGNIIHNRKQDDIFGRGGINQYRFESEYITLTSLTFKKHMQTPSLASEITLTIKLLY